jgi:hypothetical protein
MQKHQVAALRKDAVEAARNVTSLLCQVGRVPEGGEHSGAVLRLVVGENGIDGT